MKLTGNLKKQVEKVGSKEEKRSLIENAGMLLDDDELEQVSGGHGHEGDPGKRNGIFDCPPGTIEVKNEQYPNEGHHHKHCPNCDAGKGQLEDRFFFFVDTGELCQGQECHSCGARWITRGA